LRVTRARMAPSTKSFRFDENRTYEARRKSRCRSNVSWKIIPEITLRFSKRDTKVSDCRIYNDTAPDNDRYYYRVCVSNIYTSRIGFSFDVDSKCDMDFRERFSRNTARATLEIRQPSRKNGININSKINWTNVVL